MKLERIYVTLCRSNSSNWKMRSRLATFTTIMLAFTLVTCAAMACVSPVDSGAGHSCCHEKHSGGTHRTPKTEMRGCAYDLLERSNTTTLQPAPALLPAVAAPLPPADGSAIPARPVRVENFAGLYLRILVLLI